MHRYQNLQSNLAQFAQGGCLFFSLLACYEEKFNKTLDFVEIFQWSVLNEKVALDGTVNDSLAILKHIDGRRWNRLVLNTLKNAPDIENSFIIEKWYGGIGKNHFKPQNYDIYKNSLIVKTGQIKSYYLYYFE